MNKKLIKTITSVACGLGIISSIPFFGTSCSEDGSTIESINSVSDLVNFNASSKLHDIGINKKQGL